MKNENKSRHTSHHSSHDAVRIVPLHKPEAQAAAPATAPKLIYRGGPPTSHELCEAITDPIPGQGWYDDAHGKIGDICAWKTRKIGKYAVQLEWSNRAEKCL
jgi:hypothetical protein